MCEVCLKTPCDVRCPNSCNLPKVIGCCNQCGTKILDDETYYIDNDKNMFCSEECAEEYHGIEEVDY